MDPSTSAFVPGVISPDTSSGPYDPASIYQSLIQALISEQQAHAYTRDALQTELQKGATFSEQLRQKDEQIKSLTTSNKWLKGIHKYVAENDKEIKARANGANTGNVAGNNSDPRQKLEPSSQSHGRFGDKDGEMSRTDAVVRSDFKYESLELRPGLKVQGVSSKLRAIDLDDLDKFLTQELKEAHDSPIANLKETLRKHFTVSTNPDSTTSPSRRDQNSDTLIDVTPPSTSPRHDQPGGKTSPSAPAKDDATNPTIKASELGQRKLHTVNHLTALFTKPNDESKDSPTAKMSKQTLEPDPKPKKLLVSPSTS